jgi:type VI secretion system secreted protein Hcp
MYLAYVDFGKPIDDYCEATSYGFGMSHGGLLAGGATGKVQFYDMHFTKGRDSLSPAIMQHCAAGIRFSRVSVELYRDADSDVYMIYNLSDVIIASWQSSGKGESVGLNYKSMKQTYFGD